MALNDWIASLFQSEQTRGLSGGNASAVALDDSNPYYNYRLRRHVAEGNLVDDPSLLWYTSTYVKRRSGLGTHIASEATDGTANFTDVLLILSLEDYSRAVNQTREPWLQTATRTLNREFEDFSVRESFKRLYPHRNVGFRILCDGSADMGGQSLGLQAGEFVTGLLPNLYTGPVRGSYPVIGVHVNLPGVWDGYQEVGRLFNDQILFTLGGHWLDNFSHPALGEAALYRLQQYPDGSFVHIINPDLQDRYQVTSTDQGGASVLTLATREGQPLAYLVLAVVDPPQAEESARPGIDLPDVAGAGPEMAPPMLIGGEVKRVGRRGAGTLADAKTIVPDAPSERIFTLQERGALLQKVHFAKFMEGYDVFLGTRGELGTVVDEAAAIFEVRRKGVSLHPIVDGVELDGRVVGSGRSYPLQGDATIVVAGQRLEYRDLHNVGVDGWPYVGEIRRPASSSYMLWGDQYRVGRARECRVVLPDEPRNENIHWKPSVGAGATIRARTGEIPKSRFYTDSIMVASEHASIDLSGEEPAVSCEARHCYVYVRRAGNVVTLYPTTSGKHPLTAGLEPGDEVLIGNCLFHVGYTPAGQAVLPTEPAPALELSADELVESIADPADAIEEQPSRRSRRRGRPARPGAEDVPSARGLGERGIAPLPVPVEPVGKDSILGIDPAEFDTAQQSSWDGAEVHTSEPPTRTAPPPPPRASAPPPPPRADGPSATAPPPPPRAVPPPPAAVFEEEDEVFVEDGPPDVQVPAEPGLPSAWQPGEDEDDEDDWTNPPPLPRMPEEPSAGPDTQPPTAPRPEPPPPPPAPVAAPPEPPPAPQPPPAPPAAEEPPPAPEPPAAPEPAPAVPPAPPVVEEPPAADALEEDLSWGQVLVVDDDDAQFELGRPVRLVHTGWMVSGTLICGNHSHADLVLPENRMDPGQAFQGRDYFALKIRGRRGHLEVLAPEEITVNGGPPTEELYQNPESLEIEIIRRDDAGDEDFTVAIKVVKDRALPDPRARLLSIDTTDELTLALLAKGLPVRADREVELGELSLTLHFDGETGVTVSNYLDTYRQADGTFRPFFVQSGGGRFSTAPEDGAPIALTVGDRVVVGVAVYELTAD